MNRLASETSPYLRQHADNPVEWYPWGNEAFTAARERDVPVMLSVGYSSCHWCHVMAHESFEDEQTAASLNARFVPIKVDREERPDVDAIYMDAVQALTGRGGWPMTVFLTADGRPFFGGTYFPSRPMPGMATFGQVLDAIDDAWRNRREEVERQADALFDAISRQVQVTHALVGSRPEGTEDEDLASKAPRLLESASRSLRSRFDSDFGGFGPAPKFPHPIMIELCLQHHRLAEDDTSLAMATRTLKAMACGGIYDQLGGGFHRYSTDETWTVPHFEKMLYDQAGLLRAYLHAWQVTADPQWLGVVEETVEYVLRDLGLPGGGICSAQDADSEGVEGLHYVWTPREIVESVGDAAAAQLVDWYGVTETGNFEGRNILRRPLSESLVRPDRVDEARRALFERRRQRVRPGRDDKVLTEWNSMFGSALAEAAAVTGRSDWASAAASLAEFLSAELRSTPDGRWLRSWQEGRARHLAYAADYAWLVDFFTRLSEALGTAVWLERAVETASQMLDLFAEPGKPLYTTGRDAEELLVRPVELADGATPSATSVAGSALMRLGSLTGDHEFFSAGESLLAVLSDLAGESQPLAVASTVAAGCLAGSGITEVVVAGDRSDLVRAVLSRYEPTRVLAWGEPTNSPLWAGRADPAAYVCRRYICRRPSSTVADLNERMDHERDLDRSRFRELTSR